MGSSVRETIVAIIQDLERGRKGLADMVLKRVRKQLKTLVTERDIIEIDTKVSLEVCLETEMSSTGKTVAKYSNDKIRKAEITKRLARHPSFSKLVTKTTRAQRIFARMHAKESYHKAVIKTEESMERLLFHDLEKE